MLSLWFESLSLPTQSIRQPHAPSGKLDLITGIISAQNKRSAFGEVHDALLYISAPDHAPSRSPGPLVPPTMPHRHKLAPSGVNVINCIPKS
jgi:hypothetical protein